MESLETANAARVLVVEDNRVQQQVMRILLDKIGLSYHIVSTGPAAIAALEQHDFDLVLMDWRLPEMDGIQCAQRIRELDNEQLRRIPIVAVTASGEDERERCLSGGMDDYLSKPFTVEQFRETVERWLPP